MVDLVRALQAENEQLRAVLESRIVIEQAKGAMSVRLGVPTDVAFELLRGLAALPAQAPCMTSLPTFSRNGGRLHGDVVGSDSTPL